MKITELRIGNWIETKYDAQIKVSAATLIEIIQEHLLIWDIPLTEDWLKEFGFNGQPCNYAKDKLSVCLKDSDSFHKAGRTYYNSWAILEKQPTYVHQLQNLYFALTGKELERK